MRISRMTVSLAMAIAVLSVVPALALEGDDGYTASSIFTSSAVKSDVTYTGTYTERWQDLSLFEFWAPIGPGQRDGVAGDTSGNVFFLVRGRDSTDGDYPIYTGLVMYDGSGYENLVQDVMDSGWFASREGKELQAVHVSPSDVGGLTAGHPVVLRHVITGQGAARSLSVDIVSVDPQSGYETLIHSLGLEAQQSVMAIGGDGTIYVGPTTDGSIVKLTWSAGDYVKGHVPGTFETGVALTVGPAGDLYTFSASETWSGATREEKTIYRLDPDTGSASVYAYVAAWNIPYDWVWDSNGQLWIGLSDSKRKYVTPVSEGTTTSYRDKISNSDSAPWTLGAGGQEKLLVLEDAMVPGGEVWELIPGSDGGDDGGEQPKKPKK